MTITKLEEFQDFILSEAKDYLLVDYRNWRKQVTTNLGAVNLNVTFGHDERIRFWVDGNPMAQSNTSVVYDSLADLRKDMTTRGY